MKWIIMIFDVSLLFFLLNKGFENGNSAFFWGAGGVFIFALLAFFYPLSFGIPLKQIFNFKK